LSLFLLWYNTRVDRTSAQRWNQGHFNNWHPITLLSISYKHFTKALQSILMEVISYDQSTFLSMRFIFDNISLIYKTIHYAKQSQQPLYFLKLDFSKAYNKVDLHFLFQAINKLGFPEGFIHMTRLLFKDAATKVSINGQVIDAISIQKRIC
jgi:hypothetical protein